MKYRHKTKILGTMLIINMLFIIMYPKSMNLNFNNVVADSESFKLKDGFETFIENKIYSEEENLTITEYFTDELDDSCDFTEDIEDLTFHTHSGLIFYGIGFSDGNLDIQMDTGSGGGNVYLIYKMETFGMSFLHYDYIEIRAKYSSDQPIHGEENFYISFENREGEAFPYPERFTLSEEFETYYYDIDTDLYFYENTTLLYWIFLVTDRTARLDWYDFTVDYLKFWRNNITDYATQEGDSWDFSEGDKDTWNAFDLEDYTIEDGKAIAESNCLTAWDGIVSYTDYPILDNCYTAYIRIKTNRTQSFIFWIQTDISSHALYFDVTTSWQTLELSLSSWISEIVTETRIQTQTAGNPIKIEFDYILFTHNNLEDKVFYQSQNTSFYRASTGLYSYHHKFDKNHTLLEDFTILKNSSIIIDIPTLSMFPQRISFDIYSNSYFNISFFINDEEYLLYEKTTTNSWISIKKTMNRGDYILEDLETEIYFKIYSENQFIQNYLEFYLDELEIRYTENREQYEYYAESYNPIYNDWWSFNITNNNMFAEPSGVGDYAMGEDTLGCEYNVTSNELFSRRAYNNFKIDISSRKTDVRLYHYSTFTIDKIYLIATILRITHSLTEPAGEYISSEISITNGLFIDGEIQGIFNEIIIGDYFFENMYYFEFDVEIVQEDYNTIRVSSNYISATTGNSTRAQPLSFEVNTEDIKHALNIYSFYTWMKFTPTIMTEIFFPSNPTIILTIERSITHSDIVEDSLIGDMPVVPIFDWKNPFKSMWEAIKMSFTAIWDGLKAIFGVGSTLNEFFGQFKVMFQDIGNFFVEIGTNFGLLFTSLFTMEGFFGDIISGISEMFGGIGDILSNIVNIFGWIGDYFTNLIDAWKSYFDDTMPGNWITLVGYVFIGNWGGARTSWANIIEPIFDFDVMSYWIALFGGFFTNVFGFDIFSLFGVVVSFFEVFAMVSTILIVMYLIHLFKLVGSRDWDRFRTEASGIVRMTTWLIEKGIMVVKWFLNAIFQIINIIIPG